MFEFLIIIVGLIVFFYFNSRIGALEEKVKKNSQSPVLTSQSQPQPQRPLQQPVLIATGVQTPAPAPLGQVGAPPKPVMIQPQPSAEEAGGRWLGNIGIAAVFIGIAFFLKYAFDNNLISITGRIILGFAAGLALLAAGHVLRKKYRLYSNILIGGGIGILYLTVYAAFAFYSLISQPVALVIIAIITAVSVALCVADDAIGIGVIAVVGGFLTPLLISLDQNTIISLFSYIALLDIGVLIVSVRARWLPLLYTAFFGTIVVVGSWYSNFYSPDQLSVVLSFLTFFFLIFILSTFIRNLWKREHSAPGDILFITANAFGYFTLCYNLLNPIYHSSLGFFCLLLALVYFGLAYLSHTRNPTDKDLTLYLPALAVAFITLAIWFQFSGSWITVLWFVEALALFALGIYGNRPNYQVLGTIVYAVGIIRLMVTHLFVQDISTFIPVFNERFFLFLLAIITTYIIASLYYFNSRQGKIMDTDPQTFRLIFIVIANVLTVYLVTTEIMTFYGQQIQLAGGQSYGYTYNSTVIILQNQSNTIVSIFWTLYAIILIAIGFVFRSRVFRVLGLVFFFITAVKVFVDVWSLGELYRIVSSIIFGVVALTASFVYTKYRKRIGEIINRS